MNPSSDCYLKQTWIDPRQQFRRSPTHGTGSFATAPIQQGEVVEIVGGKVMTEAAFLAFQQNNPRFNAIQIDETLHLVEAPEITAQRTGGSLNHSCDANLWLADEVTLVARRDIAAGAELTIDYALFTAQAGWVLDGVCRCGTAVCRHHITGNDWQIPEVQERYYPHFSPFINRQIERLRNEREF